MNLINTISYILTVPVEVFFDIFTVIFFNNFLPIFIFNLNLELRLI